MNDLIFLTSGFLAIAGTVVTAIIVWAVAKMLFLNLRDDLGLAKIDKIMRKDEERIMKELKKDEKL